MLSGFYDDSGDARTYLVAGLIAHASRWEEFSDEWERVRSLPPAIDYYKASEARTAPHKRKHDNQFRNFTAAMVAEKERLLAETIVRYAEYSVYSPIDLADFKTLILPYVRRRKRGGGRYMGYEYHFPFHGVISATIAHLIEAGVKGDVVDFFFDEQGKVGKWARDLYDEMKARTASAEIRPYLGACTHRDDRDLVALQAADLFASRVRVWDESDPVLCILGRIPCKVSYWPQTRLKDFIATALPEVRGDNQ